jgi:8-oxo-dGTP diphosphatase
MTEPEAAVAIVHARSPEESILLIRRTERAEDSWSGHWSFPGGRRHVEDPDILHTALRELEEECGIRLGREQVETQLPHVLARRRVGPYVLVAPFVFRIEQQLATTLDTREAAESRWVPLSLLRDPSRHALRPVPGRPPEILFPGVAMGGTPLWGFTYRLITDWLDLVPGTGALQRAGFEAACLVLETLLAHGLSMRQEWRSGPDSVRVAHVTGTIPLDQIISRFSVPEQFMPAVNCLEVSPKRIRILGPEFEEYQIVAGE